jgi:hypothetical protein
MSTRLGNLKRHFVRKHNGMGNPILQYITGNSIITPEETASSIQVFRDEYAINYPKTSLRSNSQHIQHEDNWLDKWTDKYVEPIIKFNEYLARVKAVSKSLNPIPSAQFLQFTEQPQYSFRNPPSLTVGKDSMDLVKENGIYHDASGFKVDICKRCLIILSAPITTKGFSLEDFHKCDPRLVNDTSIMVPEAYAKDILLKLQNLPQVLFQLCKDWASNTSGQLYLTAKLENGLNESEYFNHEIQKIDSFPLLKRVLSESKIKLTDAELLEFLKIAINQTKATITLRRGPGQTRLKYLLAVSTV